MFDIYLSHSIVEIWLLKEQYYRACIDVGDVKTANEILSQLFGRFGLQSQRVEALSVLSYESEGNLKKAEEVTKALLEKQPQNAYIEKRLAVLKREGSSTKDAIQFLNEYLEKNHADVEVSCFSLSVSLI